MNTVHICGKRGLGDYVQSLAYIFLHRKDDIHFIFYCKKDFRYDYTGLFDTILANFQLAPNQKVSYEINYKWSTVLEEEADKFFSSKIKNKEWYFTAGKDINKPFKYTPFKKQWTPDLNGKVALSLNHDIVPQWLRENQDHKKTNLLLSKFFDIKTHFSLLKLHNTKYYYCLGLKYGSLQEEINVLEKCKCVVGIEGAWTHIAHCMNVPYISIRGTGWKVEKFHPSHPNLTVIDNTEIFNYMI